MHQVIQRSSACWLAAIPTKVLEHALLFLSMSDITYCDEDLKEHVDELAAAVQSLSQLKGNDRAAKIAECDDLLRRIKELKKGFNLELQQLPKGGQKREYQSKLKEYDVKVQNAKDNLQWARSQGDRDELLGGHRPAAKAVDPNTMNSDQMLNALNGVNTKIDNSLDRTLAEAKAALDTGKETAHALEEQGEQIEQIAQDAKEIRDHLRTADVLIKNFAKRMATDRVIQCFLFLVTVAIVVIIIFATLNPDQDTFQVPDEVKPPSSVLGQESTTGAS